MKNNLTMKKMFSYFILIIILILTQIFVFNFSAITYNNKLSTAEINLNTVMLGKNTQLTSKGIIISKDGGNIYFNDINIKSENIYFKVEANEKFSGNVSIEDNGSAYYFKVVDLFDNKKGNNEVYAKSFSQGEIRSLKISFGKMKESLIVKVIEINKPVPFKFYMDRFIIMLMLFFIFSTIRKYELFKFEILERKSKKHMRMPFYIEFNNKRWSHRSILICAMLFCIFITLGIYLNMHSESTQQPTKYPLQGSIEKYVQNIQEFDAFQKGKFNIDVTPDKNLNSLNNVYDNSERLNNNLNVLWDRALYKGKYYSYFGVAPILTIYYPIYYLTGTLPSFILVSTILAILSIIFIFGIIKEMAMMFCKRINLLVLVMTSVTCVFGTMVYMVQSGANTYYVPVESGFAFLSMLIYFAYKGYNSSGEIKRSICFLLSAVAIVLLVLSRPSNLLIGVAFILPIFISILFDKKIDIKRKVIEFLSFSIPAATGALFVMYYNYSRFGSVTQFGAIYQLTLNDISSNHVRFVNFFKAMYSYFIQAPDISSKFPWIMPSLDKDVNGTGNYLYRSVNFGVLSIPMNLSIILFGRSVLSKNTLKKAIYISVILASVIVAFLDFSIGGVHMRYVCDITLGISIVSSLILLEVNEFKDEVTIKSELIYAISILISCLTIFMGCMLIFIDKS